MSRLFETLPLTPLFEGMAQSLEAAFEKLVDSDDTGQDDPAAIEDLGGFPAYGQVQFRPGPFHELNRDLTDLRSRYRDTGASLCHLSSALFLDGVFAEPKISTQQKLQAFIERASERVLGHLHVEMEDATALDKRQVTAKLLWEVHSPRSSLYRRPDDVLQKAWTRVEEVDGVPPVEPDCVQSDKSAIDLTAEANCILSLVEVLKKTRSLSRAYGGGQRLPVAADSGGAGDGEGALEELRSYLLDVLFRRYPAFLEATRKGLDNRELFTLHDIALCLHVTTLYFDVILGPGADVICRLDRALPSSGETNALESDDNGAYYPPGSRRWSQYQDECLNLQDRLRRYARAFLFSDPSRMKPFLILVVGPPGAGKSFFVKTVVRKSLEEALKNALEAAAEGAARDKYSLKPLTSVLSIKSNLAQAASSDVHLDATWRTLFQSRASGIRLVTLEEFDSKIEGKLEQFRRVLDPLWDASTQTIQHDAFQEPITDQDLGPYVAVCVMSKATNLSSARRFLLSAEKGADFLSRIDGVIEIPPFDRPETQLEMAIMALSDRIPEAGSLRVSEGAAFYLGWIEASDNIRSIAKALKTVGHRTDEVNYRSLNTGRVPRANFERALAEASQASLKDVQTALGVLLKEDGNGTSSETCTLSLSRRVKTTRGERSAVLVGRADGPGLLTHLRRAPTGAPTTEGAHEDD